MYQFTRKAKLMKDDTISFFCILEGGGGCYVVCFLGASEICLCTTCTNKILNLKLELCIYLNIYRYWPPPASKSYMADRILLSSTIHHTQQFMSSYDPFRKEILPGTVRKSLRINKLSNFYLKDHRLHCRSQKVITN